MLRSFQYGPIPAVSLLLCGFVSLGCAASAENRSFPVSVRDAERVLSGMKAEPKPLARPLVILSGMGDPGIASRRLRSEFRKLTGDERVIGVSYALCGDFDACRKRVIDAVDKAFPSDDPTFTTEVDVVAVSMGGLVGRYSAVPARDGSQPRRLRIARLFTISTPHRGAAWAVLPTVNQLHRAMRGNSPFLRLLGEAEAAEAGYPVYPYVRLGDTIVGASNTAPYGQLPWWVPAAVLEDSHLTASSDVRIIADMARRLRGEEPLTTDPPDPLPVARRALDHAEPDNTQAAHTVESGTTFAIR